MKTILRNTVGALALALTVSIAWAGALDDALTAYKAGEWAEARAAAQSVKKSDGDYAKAQYVVGECRLMESDCSGAATAFEAVLSKKPSAVPALTGLGRAHVGSGELEKANAPLEKAVALDDTFLDAHKNLAIVCTVSSSTYSNRPRVKKAMKHYKRYFELGGNDPALEQIYRQLHGFLSQSGFDLGEEAKK